MAGKSTVKRAKTWSAEALRHAADTYFAQCDETGAAYGPAGLALALGVPLQTLYAWYDGEEQPQMQIAARMALLRIQNQLETDPRYQSGGMATKSMFLLRQRQLGGYQDKGGAPAGAVRVELGEGMEPSDLQ